MNVIFTYAEHGDGKIYEMLSSVSKQELSGISPEDITGSIQRFFNNKVIAVGSPTKNKNGIVFNLVDSKSPIDVHLITLIEENKEYKLLWSRSAYEENK